MATIVLILIMVILVLIPDKGFFMFRGGGSNSISDNYDGKGLTKNYGAGVNYNYDNNGAKFNASYFYKQVVWNF
ncbi:MAG: hypothetical protein R2771_10310 [Saprospiraceae bacterium]